jgi:hypothetical protein
MTICKSCNLSWLNLERFQNVHQKKCKVEKTHKKVQLQKLLLETNSHPLFATQTSPNTCRRTDKQSKVGEILQPYLCVMSVTIDMEMSSVSDTVMKRIEYIQITYYSLPRENKEIELTIN